MRTITFFQTQNLSNMRSIIISSLFTLFLLLTTTGIQAQDPTKDQWIESSTNDDVIAPLDDIGVMKVENDIHSVQIGSKNGSWCHMLTTAPRFYFNREARFKGGKIGSHLDSENLFLRTGNSNRMTLVGNTGYVGVNTTAPQSRFHVEGDVLFKEASLANNEDVLNILFAHSGDNQVGTGIKIETAPLDHQGYQQGIDARTSTSTFNSLNKGSADAEIALSYSHALFGEFVGMRGIAKAYQLTSNANGTSTVLGGDFVGGPENGILTLNGDAYNIGGVRGVIEGEINGQMSGGAVAAVIGEDLNTGNVESYAGLFKGKGCFTDLVKIGNVTTPVGYKLYVEEGILTERVQVALKSSADWADYVFAEDYELLPLEEVAEFIEENKHLPNVPSAEELAGKGIDMAKMDAKLMEKIEELTLYVLQLKESNDVLQQRVNDLEK